jgi:hypothetical protein
MQQQQQQDPTQDGNASTEQNKRVLTVAAWCICPLQVTGISTTYVAKRQCDDTPNYSQQAAAAAAQSFTRSTGQAPAKVGDN